MLVLLPRNRGEGSSASSRGETPSVKDATASSHRDFPLQASLHGPRLHSFPSQRATDSTRAVYLLFLVCQHPLQNTVPSIASIVALLTWRPIQVAIAAKLHLLPLSIILNPRDANQEAHAHLKLGGKLYQYQSGLPISSDSELTSLSATPTEGSP